MAPYLHQFSVVVLKNNFCGAILGNLALYVVQIKHHNLKTDAITTRFKFFDKLNKQSALNQ